MRRPSDDRKITAGRRGAAADIEIDDDVIFTMAFGLFHDTVSKAFGISCGILPINEDNTADSRRTEHKKS